MRVKQVVWLLMLVLVVVGVYQLGLAAYVPSESQGDLADFDLLTGYMAQRVLAQPLKSPKSIAVNSLGDIVVIDQIAQAIYQVHEDGTVTEYTEPVSTHHGGVAFDAADNLYVADGGGVLWKVSPGRTATQLATGVHHMQLDVSPSGDIFAVGPETIDIHHITPDGQVSVYATGMSGANDVAVNPITGEVYVSDWHTGSILRANADGTTTELSPGQPHEGGQIAFSDDGKLYLSVLRGLALVSTVDGTRSFLPWAVSGQGDDCDIHHGHIEVDNQGRIINGDATWSHLVRFDPSTETINILIQGYGNSRALALAPNGDEVFLGVSHPLCSGQGKILRIDKDGNTSVIVDDLPPIVNSITFDGESMGFVSSGGNVYTFTSEGITNTLIADNSGVGSLAVHPQTDVLWGTSTDELWYLNSSGERVTILYPFQVWVSPPSLTFTPDGTLYFYATTSDIQVAPVQQGIYRVDPTDSSFTRIADLSTVNMCCGIGAIGAGNDGNIYWVGYSDRYTPYNNPEMHMLRITPSGEVTLFARNLPIDPAAVTGDPNSTDLYFGCAAGVYRVFEANMTFIPFVVKGGN